MRQERCFANFVDTLTPGLAWLEVEDAWNSFLDYLSM